MTLEPIPGADGTTVDYFDPDPSPTSPPVTSQPSPPPEDQQNEEQPAVLAGALLPEGATGATPTPAAATPAVPPPLPKEDLTDFDHSDIEIRILLQRVDGDPRGRLVSVLIHNFSGSPVAQDFREADLTDAARLDAIQRAIYPPMQRFLLELSERKRKKLEEEAKRASRTAPPLSNRPVTPTPSSPTASTAPQPVLPAAQEQQAVPASTAQTTGAAKKEEASKGTGKTGKYQPIALF